MILTALQCVAIVFFLLLGILSSSALPCGTCGLPSEPSGPATDPTDCSMDYKPLPIFQLNHGIEATRQFTVSSQRQCVQWLCYGDM